MADHLLGTLLRTAQTCHKETRAYLKNLTPLSKSALQNSQNTLTLSAKKVLTSAINDIENSFLNLYSFVLGGTCEEFEVTC